MMQLRSFGILTDDVISARRPDIVNVDKILATITVDVSIPADKNIIVKEDEKLTKNHDLRIELERNI